MSGVTVRRPIGRRAGARPGTGSGCLTAPCAGAFGHLASSPIGPEFLQWDATQSLPPEGYIGNPAIAHRVTGSRFVPAGESEPANHFRIERISGPGGTVTGTVGRTDFFTLQGKLARPAARPLRRRAGALRRAGGRLAHEPRGHRAQHRLGRPAARRAGGRRR